MTTGATMTDMTDRFAVLTDTPENVDPAMPDVPAAIWLALVQAIVGLLVAFGIDVDQGLQDAIVQLVTVLAVVIPLADSWLRGKRNERLAAVQVARLTPVAPVVVNNAPKD